MVEMMVSLGHAQKTVLITYGVSYEYWNIFP